MPKFRTQIKASSRQRSPENTAVHGHAPIHETPNQAGAAAKQISRADAADAWSRPTNLEAPPDRPGMKSRWIRVKLGGKPDSKRLSRALREGWRPRPPDTVPGDFTPETVDLGKIGNVISADDMVLMEMPLKLFKQKQAYTESRNRRAMEAINQELKNTEKAGGLEIRHHRKSRVSVGRGARTVNSD